MKPIDRIEKFIKLKGFSIKGFEEKIGVSNGTIGTAIRRNSKVTDETLNNILRSFKELSPEWLLTGEGDIYRPSYSEEQTGISNYMWVPLIRQRAQAGFLVGWGDPEYISELPKINIEVDREYKGNYVCFEVSGDSMDNGSSESILENDIILCREVQRHHWRNKLHINQWDFVLVHRTEGILVKRIISHDVETGDLILHSLNNYYEDQKVNMNDLIAIFNVIKVIDRTKRR